MTIVQPRTREVWARMLRVEVDFEFNGEPESLTIGELLRDDRFYDAIRYNAVNELAEIRYIYSGQLCTHPLEDIFEAIGAKYKKLSCTDWEPTEDTEDSED